MHSTSCHESEWRCSGTISFITIIIYPRNYNNTNISHYTLIELRLI